MPQKKKAAPSGYDISIKKAGARTKLESVNISGSDVEELATRVREDGGCELSDKLVKLFVSTGEVTKMTFKVSFDCSVEAVDDDEAQEIGEQIVKAAEKLVEDMTVEEVYEW